MLRARWLRVHAAAILVAGCADDVTAPLEDPPVLPDVETMSFDFGFFEGGSPAATGPALQSGPGLNWAAAALSVGVANLAVVVHLAVPVVTWGAAAARTPVFEDGAWHWRFSTSIVGLSYSGDLAGYGDGGDAVFEMRITSASLGLTDFLWYEGRAPVLGTTGAWTFYDPDSPSTAVGEIEWSHPGGDEWLLTFRTFRARAGETSGDILAYDVSGTERTVTYTDASESRTAEVHWDEVTSEGYIEAPHYNAGERACWDASLQNVACPG